MQKIAQCLKLEARILKIEFDPYVQEFSKPIGASKVGEVVGEIDGQPHILPLLEINL